MRIHNISKIAIPINGVKLRPGKSMEFGSVSRRIQAMHGTLLWFGDRIPAAVRELEEHEGPMDITEAREYLSALSLGRLMGLAQKVVPPLETNITHVTKEFMILRLGRALFSPSRTLDPEAFFWLRRWRKTESGYEEV